MSICKNNANKSYMSQEPSPKGLGYCASNEKEGKKMKGKDGNLWIIKNGRWVKVLNEYYEEKLNKKLFSWWQKLALGNIIVINKDLTHKLIKSKLKTIKAQINDIKNKWIEFNNDENVIAIIWSPQSIDSLQFFIKYLIKNKSKINLDEIIKLNNIPKYLLENYKKFFVKYPLFGNKDYTFRQSINK